MISELYCIAVYVFEAIISIFYFSNKFEPKQKKFTIFLIATGSIVLSFYISKINIPTLNLLVFFICNFLILTLCYNSNIKSNLFHLLLLLSFMIGTEILVFFISSILFNIDLDNLYSNQYIFLFQTITSKLIYFIIIYISTFFLTKESKGDKSYTSLLLCIFPITSIIFIYTSFYLYLKYKIVDNHFIFVLLFCNLLSLLSNFVVFYIQDKIKKINEKYIELLLTQQKKKNDISYYKLLEKQNENSKILIHDITKHLNSLKMLYINKNIDITEYIDHIENDFNILNPIDYCNNTLLNLITNKYCEICKREHIKFDINIRNTQINFMSDPDITCLFDNLLTNSIEATKQTENKFINFSIDIRNSNFVVICISNSYIHEPIKYKGHIITSKGDLETHGIGIKSIKRVVKKYDGIMQMSYDDKQKIFTTTITFQFNVANPNVSSTEISKKKAEKGYCSDVKKAF